MSEQAQPSGMSKQQRIEEYAKAVIAEMERTGFTRAKLKEVYKNGIPALVRQLQEANGTLSPGQAESEISVALATELKAALEKRILIGERTLGWFDLHVVWMDAVVVLLEKVATYDFIAGSNKSQVKSICSKLRSGIPIYTAAGVELKDKVAEARQLVGPSWREGQDETVRHAIRVMERDTLPHVEGKIKDGSLLLSKAINAQNLVVDSAVEALVVADVQKGKPVAKDLKDLVDSLAKADQFVQAGMGAGAAFVPLHGWAFALAGALEGHAMTGLQQKLYHDEAVKRQREGVNIVDRLRQDPDSFAAAVVQRSKDNFKIFIGYVNIGGSFAGPAWPLIQAVVTAVANAYFDTALERAKTLIEKSKGGTHQQVENTFGDFWKTETKAVEDALEDPGQWGAAAVAVAAQYAKDVDPDVAGEAITGSWVQIVGSVALGPIAAALVSCLDIPAAQIVTPDELQASLAGLAGAWPKAYFKAMEPTKATPRPAHVQGDLTGGWIGGESGYKIVDDKGARSGDGKHLVAIESAGNGKGQKVWGHATVQKFQLAEPDPEAFGPEDPAMWLDYILTKDGATHRTDASKNITGEWYRPFPAFAHTYVLKATGPDRLYYVRGVYRTGASPAKQVVTVFNENPGWAQEVGVSHLGELGGYLPPVLLE